MIGVKALGIIVVFLDVRGCEGRTQMNSPLYSTSACNSSVVCHFTVKDRWAGGGNTGPVLGITLEIKKKKNAKK